MYPFDCEPPMLSNVVSHTIQPQFKSISQYEESAALGNIPILRCEWAELPSCNKQDHYQHLIEVKKNPSLGM